MRIALACLLLLTAAAAAADEPLTLDPRLPQDWVARLVPFPDEPDLRDVRFARAAWGGVIAVLEGRDGSTRLRLLPASEWRDLRERAAALVAGRPLPPRPASLPPVASSLRTWPEVPLTAAARAAAPARAPAGYPALAGRWQALLEAGLRSNVTDFREFFTPMGMIGVGFGYPFSNRAAALLNFSAGFGDMRGDFEASFGDGRANTFAFTLGVVVRQPTTPRTSFYVEADGGYYIRSLMWGGLFYDPVTGRYAEGAVLEQQDWGYGARAGVLLQRRHESKARFVDIGLSVQTTPADLWDFWTEERRFTAGDRDTWIALAVRFWDAI